MKKQVIYCFYISFVAFNLSFFTLLFCFQIEKSQKHGFQKIPKTGGEKVSNWPKYFIFSRAVKLVIYSSYPKRQLTVKILSQNWFCLVERLILLLVTILWTYKSPQRNTRRVELFCVFYRQRGLNCNQILDRLDDGDTDLAGITDIFIEPPDDSDSEGNDDSGDEGDPNGLGRSILKVKLFKLFKIK